MGYSVVEEYGHHDKEAHNKAFAEAAVGEDIAKADVIVVVFEPAALGEVDCYGGKSICFGNVVYEVES